MYVNGVSTRKVTNITEELCGKSISRSTVSRLTQGMDKDLEEWRKRPLDEDYAVLYVDAQFHKVREGGRVISKAVMTTAGVRESDGRREILSIETKEGETRQSWLSVFEGLKERGLHGVRIVVSDAHRGLMSAIDQSFTGVIWQRCQPHFWCSSWGKSNCHYLKIPLYFKPFPSTRTNRTNPGNYSDNICISCLPGSENPLSLNTAKQGFNK